MCACVSAPCPATLSLTHSVQSEQFELTSAPLKLSSQITTHPPPALAQTTYNVLILRDIISGSCPHDIDIFARVCPQFFYSDTPYSPCTRTDGAERFCLLKLLRLLFGSVAPNLSDVTFTSPPFCSSRLSPTSALPC